MHIGDMGGGRRSLVFLFLSCLLDGLDGHVARRLDACTELGAELDSLCDLADFGVCPAFIVYFWARHTLEPSSTTWATVTRHPMHGARQSHVLLLCRLIHVLLSLGLH